MGCGLSRNRRSRQDGGLDRRRTTTDLRIKEADDQYYTPVTSPNNKKGRLNGAAGDDSRGGGDASPLSPIQAKHAQQTTTSSSQPVVRDGGHPPRLQINTQRSIESRQRRKSDKNYEDEEDDDDDGWKISRTTGVQSFMGSPSFREYCVPGSRSDDMGINETGNKLGDQEWEHTMKDDNIRAFHKLNKNR